MKAKCLTALFLPSLAVLFAVLPHAKAVTTDRILQAHPGVSGSPCTMATSAPAQAAYSDLEKFTITSYPYSLQMGSLAGSCWMSSDAMISWSGGNLAIFDRATQRVTPIPGTETVLSNKHWVSIAALSPDGHWLVWAGGEDGHSTWDAISTDGAEHRQWPRDESIGTPDVAWMQDSRHWVELRNPETRISAMAWQTQPNNMRVKVYSLDTSDTQEFPLRLESPDPIFNLLPNCSKASAEFIFTKDGHAWLSQNWQTCNNDVLYSRDDVYELLPGADEWTLHKSSIYPKADPDRRMFDFPARSPDGNWIAWCNYAATGKDKPRLMLSRTDGSDMQIIYQSDSTSVIEPEWSPDSRQIAFSTNVNNGPFGIVTLDLDKLISLAGNCSPNKIAARFKMTGKFPVGHSPMLLAKKP